MSININGFNIGNIYVDGYYIREIYNGNVLIYQRGLARPINIDGYEYSLNNKGQLILTRYVGESPTKITPNLDDDKETETIAIMTVQYPAFETPGMEFLLIDENNNIIHKLNINNNKDDKFIIRIPKGEDYIWCCNPTNQRLLQYAGAINLISNETLNIVPLQENESYTASVINNTTGLEISNDSNIITYEGGYYENPDDEYDTRESFFDTIIFDDGSTILYYDADVTYDNTTHNVILSNIVIKETNGNIGLIDGDIEIEIQGIPTLGAGGLICSRAIHTTYQDI